MRAESVGLVLETLSAESSNFRVQSHGRWGMSSCPLAEWQHASGHDYKPSFAVSVEEGRSWCKCFGCGFSGSMRDLINASEKYGGVTPDEAIELRYLVAMEEAKHYQILKRDGIRPGLPQYLEEALNKNHPYWDKRGFDDSIRAEWGLGYSPEENRALIPFFDLGGTLVGAVGRAIGDEHPKYRVFPEGFDRSSFLFGEHRVTGEETALLLVEGYLDAVSASRYLPPGFGVVALGSASPSDQQIRRLVMLSNEVILGLDNDKAGILGTMKARRLIGHRAKLSQITYEGAKDADESGERIHEFVAERTPLMVDALSNALLPSLTRKSFR